jgi:hypothetical protein
MAAQIMSSAVIAHYMHACLSAGEQNMLATWPVPDTLCCSNTSLLGSSRCPAAAEPLADSLAGAPSAAPACCGFRAPSAMSAAGRKLSPATAGASAPPPAESAARAAALVRRWGLASAAVWPTLPVPALASALACACAASACCETCPAAASAGGAAADTADA